MKTNTYSEIAGIILEKAGSKLNANEKSFLTNIKRRKARHPTPKQASWLGRLSKTHLQGGEYVNHDWWV